MEPAIYDIDFTQADDFLVTITFTDEDDASKDMSDQTFTATIKEDYETSKSWDWTIDDTDSATGIVVFSLDDADTAEMPDVCRHQFKMQDGINGEKFTFIDGVSRIRRSLFV